MVIGSSEKRGKLSEAEAILVDRLSSLADSLIFHILSFLPTKTVVATSILSKRWQYLWTFVETIDFSSVDARFHYRVDNNFAPRVYRVMLSHKAECIKRMTLHCSDNECDKSDVRSWMSFALDRGVECLELMLGTSIKPPRSLFASKTLVKLKIMSADITSVKVPNAPFLPKLKELRLPHLKYDTESLERFITGCPTLEIFSLETSDKDVETLDISSPTLKRLELNSPHTKIDKILLNVPALEFLRVQRPVSYIIVEDKLSSLVEGDIYICMSAHDSYHEFISRFFQCISNVKILRLRTRDRPMISAIHAQTQFPNLTKLEIVSPYFEPILVRFFLEAAMNLEVFTMDKRSISEEHQVSWNEPLQVPKCLLSSLKKMSIRGYEGQKNELAMVNYVLRNAEVLQMMEIYSQCDTYHSDYDYETKFDMVKKITMMNRGSKSCQISFH